MKNSLKILCSIVCLLSIVLLMMSSCNIIPQTPQGDQPGSSQSGQTPGGSQGGSNSDGKQIPVYKGMSILTSIDVAKPVFAGKENGNTDNNGKHNGWYKGDSIDNQENVDQNEPFPETSDDIEEEIKDSLEVIGSKGELFYATTGGDVYIHIYISNPDQFEILSFTLNGEKYSSYMFEPGSTQELLILKRNVGDVSGIIEYTIDQIKYVDGTDIKDVKIDGDQTVEAGVRAENQVTANISDIQIGTNSISFSADLTDKDGLIAYSKGVAKAVLYDGDTLVAEKTLSVGANSVTFDGLTNGKVYQYAVVASYDNLTGEAIGYHMLAKEAFKTNNIVLFDNILVTQDGINFTFKWDDSVAGKTITALKLYKDGNLVSELKADATSVAGLLSANEYTVVADYLDLGKTASISLNFITLAKGVPNISITNTTSTQASVGFEIAESDVDNVGQITKIELVHVNGTVVAENIDVRSFDNLLSDTSYTVKVTYVYDLSDGKGAQTVVASKEIKTLAKSIPQISIAGTNSTQTSLSFDIVETDIDNVGSIYKIELVHANGTIVAENVDVRNFDNLLSDNSYTVKITYVYDLSDGKGAQTIVKENVIKTVAKVAPKITIGSASTTSTSISGEYSITDTDSVLLSSKVELYLGSTLVATSTDGKIDFAGLTGGNLYTVKVTCTYDLNDGAGTKTVTSTKNFEAVSSGLAYTVTSSKNCTVTGIGTCADTELYIPSVIDGYRVTKIEEKAFENCTSITKIVIANGIDTVGKRAFSGCTAITEITIPKSVYDIGLDVFKGCTNLKTVYYNGTYGDAENLFMSVPSLETVVFGGNYVPSYVAFAAANIKNVVILDGNTAIGEQAFVFCTNLTNVTIADSVRTIDFAAFVECTSLETIVLPKELETIGSHAFSSTAITTITIPAKVDEIGESAFQGCTELQSIYVDAENEEFHFVDGILYNYGVTEIVCVPSGISGHVVLPDTLTSIGEYAFGWCYNLRSLVIPANVTRIDSNAFYACENLLDVYFRPTTPPIFGYGVFDGSWHNDDFNIYVLESSYDAYMSTDDDGSNWQSFALDNIRKWNGCVHDFVVINKVDPTCEMNGSVNYACSLCQEPKYAVLPALGHSYESAITEPTKYTDGYTTYTCTACGYSYKDNYVSAIGSEGLAYEVDAYGEIVITGIGTCTDTEVCIPAAINGYRVYRIAEKAFENCTSINKIVISNGVLGIGRRAFYGCSSLSEITIPESVCDIELDIFKDCTSLTTVYYNSYYGNSENSFMSIPSLDTIVFGGSYVPDSIAYGATNLKNVVILDGNTFIGGYAFHGCTNLNSVVIADSVREIWFAAFSDCTSLETIVLPENIEVIDSGAFYNTAITTITIPAKVEKLDTFAFADCTKLQGIYVDAANEDFCSIDGILYNYDATKIIYVPNAISGHVVLPDSLINIGDSAFSNRDSLTSIVIPNSVTNLGQFAFYECKNLTTVTLSNNINSIGESTFNRCESLVSIVIPDSVTSIGNSAFNECRGLATATIGNGVTSIGDDAFHSCTSLTEIVIPANVTSIGSYAFSWCTSLTDVYFCSVTPPAIGYALFEGVWDSSDFNIYVLESSYDAYMSINGEGNDWQSYALDNIRTWNGCRHLNLVETVTPPTDYTDGYTTYTCTDCDYSYKGNYIPALLSSTGLAYKVNKDGTASINGIGTCTDEVIYIPSIIDGYTIVSIYARAFQGCTSITGVVIPESVTSIGIGAFGGCSNLATVVIPDSVTSIGATAFQKCSSLTSIALPAGLTILQKGAFSGTAITSIEIPVGVTILDSNVFSKCTELASITYAGTVDQWNAITKNRGWNTGVPATYVQCTDGTVALS